MIDIYKLVCADCQCTATARNWLPAEWVPNMGGRLPVSVETCNCWCHSGIGLVKPIHIYHETREDESPGTN